jgi:hypothetical protein
MARAYCRTVEDPGQSAARGTPGYRAVLIGAGTALLAGFVLFWSGAFRAGRLEAPPDLWFWSWERLGLDLLQNYHASRHWLAGGNPYLEPYGDPDRTRVFNYPPLLLPLFSWTRFFAERTAVGLWFLLSTAVLGLAAAAAARTRRALALEGLPWVMAAAAVLWSTTSLMELERGNCNVLVLGLVLAAAWALGRRGWPAELAAGVLLAGAAWVKVYPAILLGALPCLRRWRALGVGLAASTAIGLAGGSSVGQFVARNRRILPYYMKRSAVPYSHTLPGFWDTLARDTPLAAIPGTAAGLALILPLIVWVSLRVHRDPGRDRAILPYLLFLVAAGTFLAPVAYDYNLVFLPPAVVAVWDRRAPLALHLLFALLFLWWQPLALPGVSAVLLLAAKLAGLAATGWALSRRLGSAPSIDHELPLGKRASPAAREMPFDVPVRLAGIKAGRIDVGVLRLHAEVEHVPLNALQKRQG